MRLPYIPDPHPFDDPADAAVVARIAARRHPRPLQPLDRTLLYTPPVADGWNSFLGAIRTQTDAHGLTADLRELAICRVAAVNKAWYEWGHHAPLAEAAGVQAAGMDVVLQEVPLTLANANTVTGLTHTQYTVLVFADEMTRNVTVADATFAAVRALFDEERAVVELTAVIACYNCVSRFLVALDSTYHDTLPVWLNRGLTDQLASGTELGLTRRINTTLDDSGHVERMAVQYY